jgi:hypothetical protein
MHIRPWRFLKKSSPKIKRGLVRSNGKEEEIRAHKLDPQEHIYSNQLLLKKKIRQNKEGEEEFHGQGSPLPISE